MSIGDGQPVVTPVGSRVTELTDTKITLTCPTEGSPPPKITWRKDGGVLSERYGIDKNGSLTIQKAQIQDTGNYTCSAQNEAGVAEVTSLVDILGNSLTLISLLLVLQAANIAHILNAVNSKRFREYTNQIESIDDF